MTISTSAARIYATYRPRYPNRLIDDLRRRTVGEHGEHFVDWGAGTGELTLRLSPFFERITAVDPTAAMLAIAREKAVEQGVENVRWLHCRAEDVELEPESCELIASASAFHWMDRELLSGRAMLALRPGGALALVGGAGGGGIRKGDQEWHAIVAECLEKHSPQSRVAAKRKRNPNARKGQAEILGLAGFRVERFDYGTDFRWSPEEAIGYLYSISFTSPAALGERREDFERELHEALRETYPSGVEQRLDFNLTIGYRPTGTAK